MLDIAIITQKAFKDSYQVRRLIEEFKKNSTNPTYIALEDIIIDIQHKPYIKHLDNHATLRDLNNFDAYFFREIFSQMRHAINVTNLLKKTGQIVIDNNLTQVQYTSNKIREGIELSMNNVPFVPTLYFISLDSFFASIKQLEQDLNAYPIIAKKIGSGKGMGIFLINNRKELKRFVKDFTQEHQLGEKAIKLLMFQQFISVKAEYRVFVINNEIIGAMQRIPPKGDFRANYSLGGSVKKAVVTPEMKELSLKAARACKAVIAGVDYAITEDGEEYIFEVNRTPGFKGFEQATGINIAEKLVNYVISQIK